MNPLKKRDKFEEKLNEQLSGMEYKPSDSLWNRIEQNLDTDGFEPALREKLDSYTAEPNQKVWTHIENQLPEMRTRKGIFWISMIAGILAIGFGAGYWFNPKLLVLHDKNTVQKTETKFESKPIAEEKVTANIITPKKSSEQKQTTEAMQLNSTEKKSLPALVTNAPVNNATPVKANRPLKINRQTLSQNVNKPAGTSIIPVQAQGKKTENNQKGILDPPAALPLAGLNGHISPKQDKNISPETQKTEQSALPDSKRDLPKPEETKPIVLPIPEKITPSLSPVLTNESVTLKDTKDTSELYSNENVLVDKSAYLPPGDSLSKISVTATAGAQLCFLSLSMPSNQKSTLQTSFDLRQKMETPVVDYNGGFLLNYHYTENWMFSSGVLMSSFTQDINYSLIPLVGSIPKSNNYMHPTDSIGDGTQYVVQNKYSFTEIPLLVTYKASKGQLVDVEVQAGVSYAILNLVHAYMPDPSCIGLLEITDKNDFPKLKNVFFASLAPSIGFKVNNAVTLGAMPFIKVALTGMVDNEQWIQQKPWFVGLNLFIRKRF